MSEFRFYKYHDFMEEAFPFKVEIRRPEKLNTILHAHEHLQICYIRKGSCGHYIYDKQAEVIKGDIFSIPPGVEHRLFYTGNKEIELIQVDFMPFFINENMRELDSMEGFMDFAYLQPIIVADDQLLPKLNLSYAGQILVEGLLSQIMREMEEQEEGYRLSVKADLMKILVVIGREFKKQYEARPEKMMIQNHKEAILKAIEYIDNNYREEIRLEAVAVKALMSAAYFSHIFKLVTKKNFIEYLNEIRIRHGMELLKNSNLSITQICSDIGFNNLGHFNRIFKKYCGVTPSVYRKKGL